jgi:hypothetical protein
VRFFLAALPPDCRWSAFSRSLPVGVLIGLFMAFYGEPLLDRMMTATKMA